MKQLEEQLQPIPDATVQIPEPPPFTPIQQPLIQPAPFPPVIPTPQPQVTPRIIPTITQKLDAEEPATDEVLEE